MEIVVKEISKNNSDYHGFNSWHGHKEYVSPTHSYSKLVVSDSVGGCGMQQLYKWSNISNLELADAIIKKVLAEPNSGVGLFICQVGQNYYNHTFVKALEANGFTSSIEYNNIRHCPKGTYKQKIYTYHVPLKN